MNNLAEQRRAAWTAAWIFAFGMAACAGDPSPPVDAGDECLPNSAQCASMGLQCGRVDLPDGSCITCGVCQLPALCGGGGRPNLCDCAPRSCAMLQAECGLIDDGCGAEIDCGSFCVAPDSCGGGGTPNRCGRVLDPGELCGAPEDQCPANHQCCVSDGGPRICVRAGLGC